MRPKLKPPGTKRWKLKCDMLLPTSAFKFNLRRYDPAMTAALRQLAALHENEKHTAPIA